MTARDASRKLDRTRTSRRRLARIRSVKLRLEDPQHADRSRDRAVYKPLVSSAPAHSILNAQAFHYTSSAKTDIRKTFARVQRGPAFARPAAAVPRMRDDRAVSHFETVCVDAMANDTPAKADGAITSFARAGDDERAHASGGAA